MLSPAAPSSRLLSRTKPAVPATFEAGLGMGATAANPYTPGHWTQSLIIRLMIGVAIAAGLTFAFGRITNGVLLLLGEPVDAFWNSLQGFAAWQGEAALAVFIGGVFAAAGRGQALIVGLLVGAIVGFGTLSMVPQPANVPTLYFAVLPSWLIAAAALGAWLSEAFWRPPPREKSRSNTALGGYDANVSVAQVVRRAITGTVFAQVKWLRVLFASIVILLALRFMGDGVNYVIRLFDLREIVNKVGLQKMYLITLLQIVTVIIAAGLAGATTTHGPSHGFWTGTIVGVVNLLLHVFLPKDGLVQPPNEILLEIGWVFLLCLLAGGFGAMVLPPMISIARKRRAQIKI